MGITLNGETHEVAQGEPLTDLLARLHVTGRYAVERNGEIVPRSRFGETLLAEGDRIEIVKAIGGG